ncbi:MAG: hypothetical protein ACP5L5_03965 [Vulcanisaeta sp.]|uniref:hypothetical protein n=1 Tax=Vulcanisaeta sp. TaxID=2020871 RepID=UPI003D0A70F4
MSMNAIVIGPAPGGGRPRTLFALGLFLILIGLLIMLLGFLYRNYTSIYEYSWIFLAPGIGGLIWSYRGHRAAVRREEFVRNSGALWGFPNAFVTSVRSIKSWFIAYSIINLFMLSVVIWEFIKGSSDVLGLFIMFLILFIPYVLIMRGGVRAIRSASRTRRNEVRDILVFNDHIHIRTASREELDISLNDAIVCIAGLNVLDPFIYLHYDKFKIKYGDRVFSLVLPHGTGNELINVLKDNLGLEIHTCDYLDIK